METQSRPYMDEALPNLQDALALWIEMAGDLGYCHVGDLPHRIYSSNRGRLPHHELVKIREAGGGIVGMILSVPTHDMFNLFLHPDYRGTSLEHEMLNEGYDTTRRYMDNIGHKTQPVITEVHAGDERRIEAALAVGFELDAEYGTQAERLLDGPISEPQLPDGFSLRTATESDYGELAAVHSSAFRSAWTPALYREEVMRKPGYLPEQELVVVAPDGRFAAFTKIWLDERNKVGYFEPVGVHKDFHRQGLGRAIMRYGLSKMKQAGMQTAQVNYEKGNEAASGLYTSLGFKAKHRFMDYTK